MTEEGKVIRGGDAWTWVDAKRDIREKEEWSEMERGRKAWCTVLSTFSYCTMGGSELDHGGEGMETIVSMLISDAEYQVRLC